MFDLKGKVALITGGASGIGAATARRLTGGGASVVIADLNEQAAQALAKELPGAKAVAIDVTNAASIAAAIKGTEPARHSGEQRRHWPGGRHRADGGGGLQPRHDGECDVGVPGDEGGASAAAGGARIDRQYRFGCRD